LKGPEGAELLKVAKKIHARLITLVDIDKEAPQSRPMTRDKVLNDESYPNPNPNPNLLQPLFRYIETNTFQI
jgi:hypothetical protein